MEINASALAVARGEIEVATSPELVSSLLTDIASWPSWNTDVMSASLEGQIAAGTRFRWKAGPGTITSTLQRVEQAHLLAWTGKTFGINAIHIYRLEEQGGATIVRSEESWEGLLVRLLRRSMAKTLQKSIESGLQHLKAEAERRRESSPAS